MRPQRETERRLIATEAQGMLDVGMGTALRLVAGLLASGLLTLLWWRQWMYRGLIGPPDFLAPLLAWDGESAYDRKALEMFLVLFAPVVLVILALRKR